MRGVIPPLKEGAADCWLVMRGVIPPLKEGAVYCWLVMRGVIPPLKEGGSRLLASNEGVGHSSPKRRDSRLLASNEGRIIPPLKEGAVILGSGFILSGFQIFAGCSKLHSTSHSDVSSSW